MAYLKPILCTGQFQNRPCPPPGQTPGHLTFLKNFGQIPRYVASLDGQIPHPFELQRGSNPPPSRHVKQTVETSSAKFSATTNFLFSLSSLHTLNKAYSTIELYKTTTTEKPTWNRQEQWPVNAAHHPSASDRWQTFWHEVKCPTGRASFWVKFPTERSLTRVKCPGIARGR